LVKILMKIKRKIFLLFCLFGLLVNMLFLQVINTYAQDTSIEAEISSKKISLGSSLQYTITVHGESNINPIELPSIEGFDVRYLGPSTRVSIVNGQYSSSKSFVYSLFPHKVGTFSIPAFAITIAGTEHKLQSFPVEVVASMDETARPSADQPISLEDKLFIVMKAPKEEVYINEPLPIKILLFVSGLSVRDVQYPELNNIGFSMGEYEKPQQYQQENLRASEDL